jgi:hypothetical protein
VNLGRVAILSAALLAFSTPPTNAQDAKDWVDIKDPQELRALYSNKTFKGKDYLGQPFVGHYRADGEGVLIWQDNTRVPRTWEVKGNDQVCVKLPWESLCYRCQRHRTKPATHRSINVANDMVTEFTVEDGVPKF